ncbi:hypothetical protein PMAC_000766 [Pneumocystis sp. 'macacae']|nr:hypothetical protein PMAC_000766 [Pneumocystis sp. 'macacae']
MYNFRVGLNEEASMDNVFLMFNIKRTYERAEAPLPIVLGDALLLHPLSLLRLIIRIFIGTRMPVCSGTLDASSASVRVDDAFSIERLWKGGFFGKGSLSRSTLSWETRIKRLLGLIGPNENITSEERTFQRRVARRAFKRRRAEMEKRVRLGLDVVEDEGQELEINTEVKDDSEKNGEIENEYKGSVSDLELKKQLEAFPNLEHMQLHLEEAFFLSYGLGVLDINISGEMGVKTSMDMLLLFCSLSSAQDMRIESRIKQPIQADNRFLVSYVAYHHYRSLGWVVRPGVKFAVDWLLYKHGPIFSHSEFTIILFPSYSDEVEREKEFSWYWLHCINRVISQVKKTVVLCYIEIPLKAVFENALRTNKVNEVLKTYRIREVGVKRWQPSRNRA